MELWLSSVSLNELLGLSVVSLMLFLIGEYMSVPWESKLNLLANTCIIASLVIVFFVAGHVTYMLSNGYPYML